MSYRALGDALLDALDALDGADPYSTWVAQIKSMGGAVTVLPGDLVAIDSSSSSSTFTSMANSQAIPAGKFTAAQATKLGLVAPDYVGPDGSYYFAAPQDVIAYVANNGIQIGGLAQSAAAVAKGDLSVEPQWFKDLSQTARIVTGIAIAGGVLYGLSFLPRARSG